MEKSFKTRIEGKYDPAFYRERVSRNEAFLGLDKAQMRASQNKISGAVVGIAGQGGLGGGVAMALARLGVRHLKIGDPDQFDISNINRQLGAAPGTIGQNKAVIVGQMINDTMPDVTIDIYKDGLQTDIAQDFVADCDLIIDCIDFNNIDERYALHQAFRDSPKCKGCLTSKVVGFGANLCLFTRDGLKLEDFYGIAPGTEITPDILDHLVRMQASYLPRFPSKATIFDWMHEMGTAPMIAAAPPLSQYMVVARATLMLCDLDVAPYCEPLPPMPDYLWMDATTMTCDVKRFDGSFANEHDFERFFRND